MAKIKRKYSMAWITILFISVLIPLAAFGTPGKVTPEMIVDIKSVSQATLDPFGKRIAYVLYVPRAEEDEPGGRYSEIWVVSMDGGSPRQFTSKPVSSWSPRWSPDGKLISFLSERDDHDPFSQIYTIAIDGGEAKLLTHHDSDIASYQWSPDGKWIAFTAKDPKSKDEKVAEEKGRDWVVVDDNRRFQRLWLFDTATSERRKLLNADLNIWGYQWSPDSKSILFQATELSGADASLMFRKIYRISVRGGTPRVVCETEGKLGNMAISPDGKFLAYLGAASFNDPLPQSVFLVPTKGGEPENLTPKFEESVKQVDWVDNETLLLLANHGTQTTLYTLDISTGYRDGLLTSPPIIRSFSFNQQRRLFAITAHRAEYPPELFSGSLDSDTLIRLTHLNPELESVEWARQETVEWTGADNLQIEGVLTYPLRYREGRRYPLILWVHGGPEGVSQNGWTTGSHSPVQLLAARGYTVLQPNYRGSGGRGVAFSEGDHDDLGGNEFEDVLAGIDALVQSGLVDSNRVGMGGWSYGGYFSALAATRYSRHFDAAVVCAGLSNWISFAGTTDIPYEMSIVHWNSWWFDVPDLHWERSPLFYINKAETPTLIIHGRSDKRVHPEQSMELYQALKIKGVPTQLVLYPRQPHGLRERAHQLDYMDRLLSWFDKYVK